MHVQSSIICRKLTVCILSSLSFLSRLLARCLSIRFHSIHLLLFLETLRLPSQEAAHGWFSPTFWPPATPPKSIDSSLSDPEIYLHNAMAVAPHLRG